MHDLSDLTTKFSQFIPIPLDMVLHCPRCGLQHIDREESPEEYVKRLLQEEEAEGSHGVRWLNPPHRSHLCAGCGFIWRPADVATNGVAATMSKGGKDTDPHDPCPSPFVRVLLAEPERWTITHDIIEGQKQVEEVVSASSYDALNARAAVAVAFQERVIDALVINHIYRKEHDTDPIKAITDLIFWEQKIALDPTVSADAQALIDQGKAQRFEDLEERLNHAVSMLVTAALSEDFDGEDALVCANGIQDAMIRMGKSSDWHEISRWYDRLCAACGVSNEDEIDILSLVEERLKQIP